MNIITNADDLRYCEPEHMRLVDNEGVRIINERLRRFIQHYERDALEREHAVLWAKAQEIQARLGRVHDEAH